MVGAHGASGMSIPTIPGYEILRPLGEGGMGRVYLAKQQALNRLVCVKVLTIAEHDDPNLCRALFSREAELLASVTHPHILSIFDFGTTMEADLPYLVTEYIEAGDLRQQMPVGQPMPFDRSRSIVKQVDEALEY